MCYMAFLKVVTYDCPMLEAPGYPSSIKKWCHSNIEAINYTDPMLAASP